MDHFNDYNDYYGHVEGDKCPQRIARVLNNTFQRSSDVASRYGGEEFCIILPGIEHEEAKLLAEKLRTSIYENKIRHDASLVANYVTLSISSVTCIPGKECSVYLLVEFVDKALYGAKSAGRNRVETHSMDELVNN